MGKHIQLCTYFLATRLLVITVILISVTWSFMVGLLLFHRRNSSYETSVVIAIKILVHYFLLFCFKHATHLYRPMTSSLELRLNNQKCNVLHSEFSYDQKALQYHLLSVSYIVLWEVVFPAAASADFVEMGASLLETARSSSTNVSSWRGNERPSTSPRTHHHGRVRVA